MEKSDAFKMGFGISWIQKSLSHFDDSHPIIERVRHHAMDINSYAVVMVLFLRVAMVWMRDIPPWWLFTVYYYLNDYPMHTLSFPLPPPCILDLWFCYIAISYYIYFWSGWGLPGLCVFILSLEATQGSGKANRWCSINKQRCCSINKQ